MTLLNLNQVDLNLLVILNAVLQERSVSKAALRVGRSQPAISHALQRLRKLFRDELLVRVGQRYELTAVAQGLVDPLHTVLRQMSDLLVAQPVFDPNSAQREFSLSVSDFAASVLVPPIIREITRIAPGIRLNIGVLGSDPISALRNGDLDLVVCPPAEFPKSSDLEAEAILRDPWCYAAWSGNDQIGDTLTLETFESLPHVGYLFVSHQEAGSLSRTLTPQGVHLNRYVVKTNYVLLMPFLLEGTPALALLPRRLAEWLRGAASLRILDPPIEMPDFVQEMWWSARHTADPAHLWLRNLMKTVASQPGPAM